MTSPSARPGSVPRGQESPWVLRPRRRDDARLRLFCFPYAGGGASTYRGWVNRLPEDVECCLIQPPGKESRVLETPLRSFEGILPAVDAAIRPLLDLPFVFFGHSMGGKVAFELARKLRREGRPLPERLFISATRAPGVPDPDPPIHHLPDDEFVAEIQKRYDAIPKDVIENEELLELVLPGLRGDFIAMETHVHEEEPPLDCPITCLGGEGDHRVGEHGLRAWEAQTKASFGLEMFRGDHFFIQSESDRVVPFLIEQLRSSRRSS